MPKRIPISAAKKFAVDNDCRQVVIAAWDGDLIHVVTYGKTIEDCDQAALAGERYKKALGWPETLNSEPSRVRTLRSALAKSEASREAAEARVAEAEKVIEPFAAILGGNYSHQKDNFAIVAGSNQYDLRWEFSLSMFRAARTWMEGGRRGPTHDRRPDQAHG